VNNYAESYMGKFKTQLLLCVPKLGLDLVHKDHLSVFTFAETKERFGLAKLVADGEGSDLQVMSLKTWENKRDVIQICFDRDEGSNGGKTEAEFWSIS
jgi:hypothetical protein